MSGIGARGPVHSRQLGMVELYAKAIGAGAAAPTGLEGDASGVTRSGAGVYVFTFPIPSGGLDIRDVNVSIRQASSKELIPFYTYDESAGTVTVTVKDATNATPFTDTDLTSSEEIHIVVKVKTLKV